jgi:hypothetical protein
MTTLILLVYEHALFSYIFSDIILVEFTQSINILPVTTCTICTIKTVILNK